jgi:hypothetical protein
MEAMVEVTIGEAIMVDDTEVTTVEAIMVDDTEVTMGEAIMAEGMEAIMVEAIMVEAIMGKRMEAIMAIERVTTEAAADLPAMPTIASLMGAMHSGTTVLGIDGNTIIGAGISGAGDGPISTVTYSHSHFGHTLLTTHSGSMGPISFSPTCSGRALVEDICHKGTPGLTIFTATTVPLTRCAVATHRQVQRL